MLWIESVRSLEYQPMNVAVSAAAKIAVATGKVTPKFSTMLSVSNVPTTLIITIAIQ